MKWNMTIRDLTSISICIAIAVILGKVLGILHGVLPFSRGIVNAPFYSFLIALMLYRTRKPGTMTLFALGYGAIMIGISSIFMSIAVVIGGIIGDLILLTVVRKYDSNFKIALCAPIYSAGGIFGTFIVVTFMTESARYVFQGPIALIISIISVYIIGLSGSLLAMKIMPAKLEASGNCRKADDLKMRKLTVNIIEDILDPLERKYTLTHSDETGMRFLFIGPEYAEEEYDELRDEVTAYWDKIDDVFTLKISCLLKCDKSKYTSDERLQIFKRHMPEVLKVIINGDLDYIENTPGLLEAENNIYYYYDEHSKVDEVMGRVSEYILT